MDTPDDYRKRAEECRYRAETAMNDQAREVWKRMVDFWEERAKRQRQLDFEIAEQERRAAATPIRGELSRVPYKSARAVNWSGTVPTWQLYSSKMEAF